MASASVRPPKSLLLGPGAPERFGPLLLHGRQVHGMLKQQAIELVLGMGCVAGGLVRQKLRRVARIFSAGFPDQRAHRVIEFMQIENIEKTPDFI